MKNAISWFEIPSVDLDRATKFYEAIFGISLIPLDVAEIKMRMFPIDNPEQEIGGAVVYHPDFYATSSTHGALVYLNANPDVQLVLDRVQAAGGTVIVPKTPISEEYGFMGIILDTEGNRIGLHSLG